ncbi:hypothetical protein Dred_0795 [Desulforamulus reducens MI-1]|uniref:Uncharacterized protein n=1 Tax=Desulforamulus reducens (strain ATCC BAA-1160 / DSM 100696 / MI-1) TaxID=349161 RepID=A4J2N0_DESRM|nr:hypothetical protein [Desulforamulus reducens]ABO49333.1 hypothetical protein Dred_0795 [Desulforamulus reducens MI-1]
MKIHKKALCAALIIITLCNPAISLAAQRFYPGDEWPAEKNQIGAIDIHSEKILDATMYPVSFAITALATVSIAGKIAQKPVTATFQKIFVDMSKRYAQKYGYVPVVIGAGTGQTGSTALLWMNWPPSRYIFENAEAKLIGNIGNGIANTIIYIFNGIANLLFSLTKTMVLMANNIIFLAFDTQWVQATADWISDTTQLVGGEFSGKSKMKFASILFLLCLSILAGGVALYIYNGHIVKAGKIFLGAAISIAALYFYLGYSNTIIKSTANFMDAFAGAALEMAGVILPETEQTVTANMTPLEKGLAQATNAAWTAMVACPWSWGQFGTADPDNLKLTASSSGKKSEWDVLKDVIPPQQTVPPSGQGIRLSRSDLEAKKDQLYIDTLFLGSDDAIRSKLLNAVSADQVGFAVFSDKVDHGAHAVTVAACQPSVSSVFRHIGVAFITIFPAGAYLTMVLFLAIPIIISQLGLMVALIFLPLIFIVGVAGETGQIYLKKGMGLVLQCFSIKIVYGLYMGVILFLAALISTSLL